MKEKRTLQARDGIDQMHFKLDYETRRMMKKAQEIAAEFYGGPVTESVMIRRGLRELYRFYLKLRKADEPRKSDSISITEADMLFNASRGFPMLYDRDEDF
jgi:hypothetical protein